MKKRLLLMLFMLLMFVIFALTLPTRPPTFYPTPSPGDEEDIPRGACRMSDLGGAATWQAAAGGALSGRLTLTLYGESGCSLQGRPRIRILPGDGEALPVDLVIPLDDSAPQLLSLSPRASAHADFEWRNACGDAPDADLRLEVTLPGHPGKLLVLVTDPNGNALRNAPACDAPDEPSTLAVKALVSGAE